MIKTQTVRRVRPTRVPGQLAAWDVVEARRMWYEGSEIKAIAAKVGAAPETVRRKKDRDGWVRRGEVAKAAAGGLLEAEVANDDGAATLEQRQATKWRRRMLAATMLAADTVEATPVPTDIAGQNEWHKLVKAHVDLGYKLFGLDRPAAQAGSVVNVNIGLLGRLPDKPVTTVDTGQAGGDGKPGA